MPLLKSFARNFSLREIKSGLFCAHFWLFDHRWYFNNDFVIRHCIFCLVLWCRWRSQDCWRSSLDRLIVVFDLIGGRFFACCCWCLVFCCLRMGFQRQRYASSLPQPMFEIAEGDHQAGHIVKTAPQHRVLQDWVNSFATHCMDWQCLWISRAGTVAARTWSSCCISWVVRLNFSSRCLPCSIYRVAITQPVEYPIAAHHDKVMLFLNSKRFDLGVRNQHIWVPSRAA